jgi:hypothetical protein
VQVAGFVISLIAIGLAIASFVYATRADRRAGRAEERAERAEAREERRERREEAEAAARKSGRPFVEEQGGGGGPTANPVNHNYKVRNIGPAVTTGVRLWITDAEGRTVSNTAGGLALAPNDPPTFMTVSVPQPLPTSELKLIVGWNDSAGEHTEWTGIRPPRHH